jgi:RNA polymerase sigma-70 factor (ECF subfamily)
MEQSDMIGAAARDLQTLFGMGATGTLSDGQLLDRFVEGREEAVFEAIVRRHGPMVWGVCRRILRDHHDAEDAFQATFLVLARRAAAIMPRDKLGNWLYGVAHRVAMKARATRARRRVREGRAPDMPELEASSQDQRNDLAEWLDEELSRLPEKYRAAIVLCDLEDRTHKEAASQLGWPIGTVSSRLVRARAMLAKRLVRRGLPYSAGSLAGLLVRESASAGVPADLIGSTARAAGLFVEGGAAGVVPAGVMILTREAMKIMLISKLKIGAAMLLAVSALTAGGTSLAYRAQADGPVRKEDPRQPVDEKNDVHLLQQPYTFGDSRISSSFGSQSPDDRREDLQRLIDEKQKELQRLIDEQNREDRRKGRRYAAEMTALEREAKGKPPEVLDKMIEEAHWQARMWDAKRVRLQHIKEAVSR